jgi:microcystin-dependent protein
MGSTTVPATSTTPANNTVFARAAGGSPYTPNASLVEMSSASTSEVGGNGAHNNRQPYLGLNFIIALTGIYPSRT